MLLEEQVQRVQMDQRVLQAILDSKELMARKVLRDQLELTVRLVLLVLKETLVHQVILVIPEIRVKAVIKAQLERQEQLELRVFQACKDPKV